MWALLQLFLEHNCCDDYKNVEIGINFVKHSCSNGHIFWSDGYEFVISEKEGLYFTKTIRIEEDELRHER